MIQNIINLPPKKSSLKKELFLDKKKSSANLNKKVKIYTKKFSNNNLIINNKFNAFNNNSESNNNCNKTKVSSNTITKINDINKKEELDDFEMNNLEYNEAINLDKRLFIPTYSSVLKREHLIIFTFFIRNDHNIIYIKFCRFIFLVCTDMALNVFFLLMKQCIKCFWIMVNIISYNKFLKLFIPK